jgi:hypothetical protein
MSSRVESTQVRVQKERVRSDVTYNFRHESVVGIWMGQ